MSDVLYAYQPNAFQSNAFYNIETIGQFAAFLARTGEQRCVLIEMDYIYEGADSPTGPATGTLYFSDREFFDDVTDHPYVDCVRAAPQYTRALSGDQLGSYVSSVGTLELDNADGELDFLLSVACDGSPIRFYLGRVDWEVTRFVHIFTAITSKVNSPTFDRISVVLKDTGLLLDKSVGGTTTVGGSGANAERARPVNIGYIHNLQPPVKDSALLIYTHSDTGTGTAAQEVRDRGVSVAFTENGDGTFTLTASPTGMITADVLAEPLGSDLVRVSHVMLFLVGQRAGLSAAGYYNGPGRTYTTQDQDDYKLGISLSEARNVIDVLAEVCESGNCFWAIKRTGEFTFGRLRLNDIASFGLQEIDIYEDDIDQGSFRLDHSATQYYKFQATMSRNQQRQTDFAGSLSPDEQATYSRQGIFLQQPDSVGTDYANAPELYHKTLAVSPVIDTLLSEVYSVSDVDSLAQWMTTRRAIFLPWIEVISITVGLEFYPLELGDPVRLFIAPRMGEDDSGVLFQVIGITIRLTDAKVDLKIARRNVVQPIPASWTKLVQQIDESQPPYVPGPPVVEPIDVTAPVDPPVTQSPSIIDDTGKWRLIYVRPRRTVHPDILLWVPFTTGSAVDISSYHRNANITFDTGGAAAITTNGLEIDLASGIASTNLRINYRILPAPYTTLPSSVPLTFEWFVTWYVNGPQAQSAEMIHFDPSPTTGSVDIRKVSVAGSFPITDGDILYDDSDVGTQAGPTTNNCLGPSGTRYHMAWVYEAGTTGIVDHFYVDGVEQLNYTHNRADLLFAADAQFSIGGLVDSTGSPATRTTLTIGEVRVVRRNLYPSGTTFTPPTMGNLSVIS